MKTLQVMNNVKLNCLFILHPRSMNNMPCLSLVVQHNTLLKLLTYMCRLCSLAKHCKFSDLERELHTQILQGGIHDEVDKHSLCKPDLKLDELMTYAHSLEMSKRQIAQMSGGAGSQP